jgi:hypothetical protein
MSGEIALDTSVAVRFLNNDYVDGLILEHW